MTSIVSAVTFITSLGVVAMNILTIFLIYVVAINKISTKKEGNTLLSWVSTHAFTIIVVTTLLSLGGSYFYSLYAGFDPCKLCWYQRTFFYGFILLYIIGWYQRSRSGVIDKSIFVCHSILTVFALIVSIFQYYGSIFNPDILATCEAQGISCSKSYFIYFGYINIPMMALAAFAFLLVITLIRILYTPSSTT